MVDDSTAPRAEISLPELLPQIYAPIVNHFTGRDLLTAERTAILQALANSISWSVVAAARETKGQPSSSEVLTTLDRFGSKWTPRPSLLDQICKSSGLDQRMANLALILIEVRTDLAVACHGSVVIANVFSVDFLSVQNWADAAARPHDLVTSWSRDVFAQIAPAVIRSRSRIAMLFKPRSTYLTAFVETLELSTVFRPVVAYRIALMPEARLTDEPSERFQEVVWKKPSPRRRRH